MSISDIIEAFTASALFISVGMVFIELRRNGKAYRLNNALNFTERLFQLRNLSIDIEIAEILVKGRADLYALNDAEQIVFKNYLLNTAQTASVMLLAREGQTLDNYNIKRFAIKIILAEWNNKGGRTYWREINEGAPLVQHVMDILREAFDQTHE